MPGPYRLLGALAFLAFAVLAACREDVAFTTPQGDASSEPVAQTGDASIVDSLDATSDARFIGPSHRDGSVGDASCLFSDEGGRLLCNSNGTNCRTPTDCCSSRCEGNYCLPSGTCEPPGSPCATRTDCCSGRCEPNDSSGALTCQPYCAGNGSSCASAESCCSLACNGGQCGGPICGPVGTDCETNADCCAGKCEGAHCAETFGTCLPTGEACGDDSGLSCCSGVCNEASGRCDLGPGPCREMSTPCASRGDCCIGQCIHSAVLGVSVCTAQCLSDGKDCNSNTDCCDGLCTGLPSHCGLPAGYCLP